MDNRATGRGNSSGASSRRGGSKYAPLESVDHRESPPKAVVEEEKPDPDQKRLDQLDSWLDAHDRAIEDLERDVRHEHNRRHCLIDEVQKIFRDRDANRAAFLSAQLENERSIRSLRDELAAARQDNSHFREELAALRTQTERLESERKNLLEILERGIYLHRRKRPRTDSTGGGAPRKT